MSTDSHRPDPARVAWRSVVPSMAALAWCTVRLGRGIGPHPLYDSDSAVPILLMRGLGEGAFTLFYPGQDRYGMWPYLVARALRLETPEAFHTLSVLALCFAALPLWRLLGSPSLAVLTLLVPVVVSPLVAEAFFDGQPYLWQGVSLLWAWAACRSSLEAEAWPLRALSLVLFALGGVLAAWTSTLSLLGLLGVLVLEAWQARDRPVRVGLTVLASGTFGSIEAALRSRHAAFSRMTFGTGFSTHLPVDHGHLLANLARVGSGTWREGVLLPVLLAAASLPIPGREGRQRIQLAILLWLGLCTLPALVVIAHFRLNDFHPRYFCLPAFWAVAAATYGIATLLERLSGRWDSVALAVALGVLALVCPVGASDPLAGPRGEAARLVGGEARVLLGHYREVYVPASLAPGGTLLPLPVEGEYDRFPALQAELRPGRPVLAPCGLDAADGTLQQYGAVLRRTAAAAVMAGASTWCLHDVDRPARSFLDERRGVR